MATIPAPQERFSHGFVRPVRHREYVEAHQQLLDAMSVMEELTASSELNPLRLSHARLRVTRASLERRELFRKVVAQLGRNPTTAIAHALAVLQRHDLELLDLTSEHLATWTPARIKADSNGYCESTRNIRAKSRANIEREIRLLYPLLGTDHD